jgi:hypothetical protein
VLTSQEKKKKKAAKTCYALTRTAQKQHNGGYYLIVQGSHISRERESAHNSTRSNKKGNHSVLGYRVHVGDHDSYQEQARSDCSGAYNHGASP